MGALIGNLVSVPTAIASFAMTSIFICLLCMQKITTTNLITVGVAVLGVLLCKLTGLSACDLARRVGGHVRRLHPRDGHETGVSAHSWFDFAIITASVALTMLPAASFRCSRLKAAPAIQCAVAQPHSACRRWSPTKIAGDRALAARPRRLCSWSAIVVW